MNDATVLEPAIDSRSLQQIGTWALDPDGCELRRGDEVVEITPRLTAVLLYMLERAGDVVTSDEIRNEIAQLGNGNGNGVYKCISELRRALGDDPRNPTYIQTVPKRGYRLIAAGTVCTASDKEPVARARGVPEGFVVKHGPWATLVLSIALLAGIVALAYVTREPLAAPRESIAVLQFENVDGDPANDDLAAAMSQATYSRLSKARVCYPYLATTLPMQLSDASRTAIGAALKVDHVLSGSLQRSGNLLRASAEIVRVEDGSILYSVQLDRPLDALGGFERELAARVTRAGAVVLNQVGRDQLRRLGTASADAMFALLDGNHYRGQDDRSALRLAAERYRKAIAFDPTFVVAYFSLVAVLDQLASTTLDTDERSAIRQEISEIHIKVADIDPQAQDLPYIAFTESRLTHPDLYDAEAQLRERIASHPDDLSAYGFYVGILISGRLYTEALAYEMKTRERYPPIAAGRMPAFALFGGNPRRYIALVRENLRANPNMILDLAGLVGQLARLGEFEEAESYLSRLKAIDEGGTYAYGAELRLRVLRGELPLGSAALEEAIADPRTTTVTRGAIYFMLGDVERGVTIWRQLEPSLKGYIPHLETLFPDAVRKDPRYVAMLEEIGVGRSWTKYLRQKVAELAPITGIEPAPIADAVPANAER